MTTRRQLSAGWTLELGRTARQRLDTELTDIPAIVPGCVHTDLMAAGLLADPLLERNESSQHWIGWSDWSYRSALDAEPPGADERLDLVFDGLDTMATVAVNDTVVGVTENQHRTYRFDIGDVVHRGSNRLAVRFGSPDATAASRRDRLGDLPNPYGAPYNFLRKMACNFGWDWGPRVTTSGIWRPVRLERWSTVRIAQLRASPRLVSAAPVTGESGRVDVAVDLEWVDGQHDATVDVHIEVVLVDPGGELVATGSAAVRGASVRLFLEVPSVRRWFVAGTGDQPLYRLVVTVVANGEVRDRTARTVGFRHVRLDTSPVVDARPGNGPTTAQRGDAKSFAFVVNGDRVWIRGVNWIPHDCFPSNVTRQQVRARIDQAVAANANLLRVWGGGLYESDDFYDWCDRRGLLVWQDFAFACAAYPEAELWEEVAAEATDNVNRLMTHPSLVVWSANNECLMGWHDWGWPELVGDRPWGENFYRKLLPEVTTLLDPDRPFIDGSPTSIDPTVHPNEPDSGTVHLWDVWNDHDYTHYRSHAPSFVAEFGFQAPPTWSTFQRALSERALSIDDAAVQFHQRAFDGHEKLARWLRRHQGPVTDYDDWLFGTQLNQARAIEVGVGHFRALHDRCSGVVWWQLNDCWASVSWSVVDGDGRLKPSWYAMRRAFADRLVVLRPTVDDQVEVVLVNDSRDPWADTAVIQQVGPHGGAQTTTERSFAAPAHSTVRLDVGAVTPSDGDPTGTEHVTVVTVGRQRSVWTSATEIGHVAPSHWDAEVAVDCDGMHVEVTATTLVRDLCLFADRVDSRAGVDDQLITLLAGERHRFRVHTAVRDRGRWLDAVCPTEQRSVVVRARGDRLLSPDGGGVTTAGPDVER